MGVKGLLAYILSSSDLRKVQLSILASSFQQETGKGPKLLFKLSEIAAEFWSSPITVLKKVGDYPEYTSICGPDFHLVSDRVCCFVKALRSLGIEPVFFVDPPADHDSNERLQVLMNQNSKKLANMYLIQQVLEHSQVQSFPHDNCNNLVKRQLLYSLRAEGTEVVFCTQQADSVIASYVQSHPETCGVVSDNSEFAIISGCVLFPLVGFDFKNFTGLRNAVSVDKSPGEIISVAITSAGLAKSLEIREDQLPDLAVLCGMERTCRFIHRLSVLTALGVEGSGVKEIAAWLKCKDTPLMAHSVMQELCRLHPDFSDALEQSYNKFSLQGPSQMDLSRYASPLYELVETEMLKYGELAFSAAKQGNVWLDVLCENLNLGQPSMVELLRPIRKNLYTLLGVREVHEYGRTTSKACEVRVVPACGNQEEVESSIKNLHSLRAMDRRARLVAAYQLTTALTGQSVKDMTEIVEGVSKSSSQFPNIEWPKLHKLALVCCSLAVMAHLNKASEPSLAVTDRQLDALLLSCLTCTTEGTILPHIVHVLPSMRAVSISEWFCVALDVLYETMAILGVTDASPEPRNIFYPMAFIPYHLALESHSDLTSRQELDINSVKTAMQTALSLPAVMKFRSCVFDTNELLPLPDLIVLCSAALNEVLENAEQLLPRTMTASLEELVEKDDEESSEEDGTPEPTQEEERKQMVWGKEELPIMEHRETILELIAGHQVVCIEGETGCGKSSQVPQFILEQFQDSKILVSQPNSLAAKKLSERVSEELEVSPDTVVTFCDVVNEVNRSTRLVYGTNGFTLQALLEGQDTRSYTHVILDEIHERTTDIDFAMFLLRQLAVKFPDLKVVLMSATLQGKLFVNYFKETLGSSRVADPYFVGIRRFPVHVFFIDQLSELVAKRSDAVQENAMRELEHLQNKLKSDASLLAHSAEVSSYAQEVCIHLILSQPEPGDTILVFLPGMGDMIDLHSALLRKLIRLGVKQRYKIFVFHNQVPIEDEREAFGKPRDGQANIIISHTIAESSITFPHLKMVINFAIRRCMIYDPKRHMSTLTRQWCSKASCTQREGRVGRLSEGTAIHLIMKQDYDKLADFNLPDIATEPLSKTVLHAKKIIRMDCGVSLPSQLLSSLIEPPSLLQFEAALHDLVEIGAIHHNPEESSLSEEAEITLLGEFCLGLPLDLRLCRLVLLGILFGCPLDAVVIAASLSMYKDIFTLPTRLVMNDMKNYCDSLTRSTFSRLRFDNGCFSNAIMVRNMFLEWRRFLNNHLHSHRREMANQFSRTCAIRSTRLLHFDTSVADISRAVVKWLPKGSKARAELVALSQIDKVKSLAPVLCSNTYFIEEPLSSQRRPTSAAPYVPVHLRNLPFQKSPSPVYQLHFCDDNILLKTLILAASPKDLMYGERSFDSWDPSRRAYARRCVKMAEEEGFYPSETLTMDLSSLSDVDLWSEQLQKTDEASIHGLYDSLPRGFRFPIKVKVDKETDTAVLNFYSSAEAANNVVRIARDMGYVFGSSSAVDRSTANLSKLSPELQVLWRLGECHSEWQVEGVNALFPYLGHPCQLRWVMLDKDMHPVNSIFLNYRNPTGLMCVFKAPLYPYLAVASRCFLSPDDVMMTPQITLLPPPPQSLMMILAFQLPTSVTELLIDRTADKVRGLRLNGNEIHCENIESYISGERLREINQLRLSLSNALSLSFHSNQILLGDLGLKELQENLAAVLASSAEADTNLPSSNEQAMATDGSGRANGDLMWEMITPGKLLDEGPSNSGQFYYPELRCSLLGSEPYATVAARVDKSTLSTTPSPILYKETVSTKLLLENSECLENSTTFDDEQFISGKDELIVPYQGGWVTDQDQNKGPQLVEEKLGALIQPSGRSGVVLEKEVSSEVEGEGATPPESKKKTEMPTKNVSFAEQIAAKLEQEIVRHLQRNNKMEFLSELRIQRRIKHVCSLVRMTLNVPFFLQRPNLFQVREVEEGGEGADAAVSGREYLIVLDQSKWQDVDSEEEEPVLPPSVRIVKKSQKIAASIKKPLLPIVDKVPTQEGGAGSALPIVKEHTQTSSRTNTPTEKIPFRNSTNVDSTEDKPASKVVKSSHSKPLTATKAVKLPETKANTPHISVVEDKKKVDTAKKSDLAAGKPLSATRSSGHSEVTDQAKSLPAKKATPTKKKGPQPGSDDHLALHLHDYIKRHGGEVRLAVMRKEAFPEYYEKHPNLRYGGYRYLRKMFLLDYPEYFDIFEDNKILYVRAVEEKEVVVTSKSKPSTHDAKQEKKTGKQGQGKEGGSSAKKTVPSSVNQEATQQSAKPSSTTEPRPVNGKKDKPLTFPGTEKAEKHAHVATDKTDLHHPSKQGVQTRKPDTVQFVQVPTCSSSRLSQEPSELDTDSIPITQSTPSHSLSQSRSRPQTSDQQVITQLLSLATGSDPPQQPTSDQMVHVTTLESEEAAVSKPGHTWIPVGKPAEAAIKTSTTIGTAPGIVLTSEAMQVPMKPTVSAQPIGAGHPSVSAEGGPGTLAAAATPPPDTRPAVEEDEWHSSEESWLSEEEFEAGQGTPGHIARYLHNYLSTHSFPFGCRVPELDRVYQSDYRQKFHSKKVASITTEFLQSHSRLFKLREETFLKLREGFEHVESANSFRGRPYTPEHINEFYSNYFGNEGFICSLLEAQHVFETRYRKEFKMPPSPLIWFVGESFFKRSFQQFVLFNDIIVLRNEGK